MTEAQSSLKRYSTGEVVPITDNMVAGRLPECGLVLTEGHPSRQHARFVILNGEVSLEDLGSANGTFVNDRRIDKAVILRSGDTVRFDVEKFEFVAADATIVTADDRTVVRTPQSVDVDGGKVRQGPAWIDPAHQGAGGPKTEFIDAAAMQEMVRESGGDAADLVSSIDTPMLLVTSGANTGLRINLTGDNESAEWTIGSDKDRDIILDEHGVSGVHAKLSREGARWKLLDQMSANGTFVNGKRSNMSYLDDQDRIRIGPIECVFRTPARFGRATQITRTIKPSPVRSKIALIVIGFLVTLVALFFVFRTMM